MKTALVTRTFQGGKSIHDFDVPSFEKNVMLPIKKMLGFDSINGPLIVIVNGDSKSKLSEIATDGEFPSEHYLKERFSDEISSGKIIVKVCEDWGNNPGSAIALNEGDKIATKNNADMVIHWSPEFEFPEGSEGNILIYKAIQQIVTYNLFVVGFARQNWWEKPQWFVPQNTASIWRLYSLNMVGGFSSECNDFGTITNEEIIREARNFVGDDSISQIAIAGMEDFHAMLKMLQISEDLMIEDFRWGVIRDKPAKWNTNFPKGSDRLRNHLIKVFRQYLVMQKYAESVFPNDQATHTIERVFNRVFIQ